MTLLEQAEQQLKFAKQLLDGNIHIAEDTDARVNRIEASLAKCFQALEALINHMKSQNNYSPPGGLPSPPIKQVKESNYHAKGD